MLHQNDRSDLLRIPDRLSFLSAASARYDSYNDFLARFVEREQLLRDDLWEAFIHQYTFASDDCNLGWRGEYWGKMMRGACLTYRYTGSETLYAALTRSVEGMLAAQDSLGRFSTYSVEKEFDAWDLWARKYILLGFEFFCDICRDEALKARIIAAITRHADYIMRFIGEGKRDIRTCTRNWGGLNSCSILEPYVHLYCLTGKEEYLAFAGYIISTGFCSAANMIDLVEQDIPPYRYPVTKAYEMMSCFEGLIEYYAVTGEERWLNVAEHFAALVHDTDVTVIGCCGCTHELFDHSAACQTEYREVIMQETCVTVTWMKLCTRLLLLTGKKCYADFIEEAARNAMPGSVNDAGNKRNEGITFDSYSPLYHNTRGRVVGGNQPLTGSKTVSFYGCCACIGAAGTALSCLTCALSDPEGLTVLFYEKGKITFRTPGGQEATLTLDAHLPERGTVRGKLTLGTPETFRLRLRVPDWSGKTAIRSSVPAAEQDGYISLFGEWKNGDTFTLSLDISAKTLILNDRIAVRKGPFILALDQRLTDFTASVSLKTDKNGITRAKAVTPPPFAKHAFLVPTTDGTGVLMIDYASAGKNWDDQQNCGVTVWMDRK